MDEQHDATKKPEVDETGPEPAESGGVRAVGGPASNELQRGEQDVPSAPMEDESVEPDQIDDAEGVTSAEPPPDSLDADAEDADAVDGPLGDDDAAESVVLSDAAVEREDDEVVGDERPEENDAVAVSDVAGALGFVDSPVESADDMVAAGAEPGPPVADPQLKAIIEALVFASPDPLTIKSINKVLVGESPEAIDLAVEALKQDYARAGGLQMVEVAGGFQIVTRPDLHEWVRRLFHERTTQKLSVAALETLAVIAYKQPITAAEIADVRGVNTSGVLGTLIDRKLVKITGRKQVVGRPFMYATTREFLNRFGLRDLNDLPKVEDMADALGFEPPLLEDVATTAALPFGEGETAGPGTMAADAVDDVIGEEPPAHE